MVEPFPAGDEAAGSERVIIPGAGSDRLALVIGQDLQDLQDRRCHAASCTFCNAARLLFSELVAAVPGGKCWAGYSQKLRMEKIFLRKRGKYPLWRVG